MLILLRPISIALLLIPCPLYVPSLALLAVKTSGGRKVSGELPERASSAQTWQLLPPARNFTFSQHGHRLILLMNSSLLLSCWNWWWWCPAAAAGKGHWTTEPQLRWSLSAGLCTGASTLVIYIYNQQHPVSEHVICQSKSSPVILGKITHLI